MPRDVSLSDSKCWNGGHEFKETASSISMLFVIVVRTSRPIHWREYLERYHEGEEVHFSNQLLNLRKAVKIFDD